MRSCFFLSDPDEIGQQWQIIHVRKLPRCLQQLHHVRKIIHIVCLVLSTVGFRLLPELYLSVSILFTFVQYFVKTAAGARRNLPSGW